MSSEAKSQAQLDAAIPLPTTVAELRELIAATIDDLFKDPRNARVFATYVAQANANALQESIQRLVRENAKPVVVKIEYPNSWKAEVGGDRNALSVTLTERGPQGEWVPVDAAPNVVESLSKLVLTSTAVPGDIFYVTTTGQIDQAYESATDQLMQQPLQEQASRAAAAAALEAELQKGTFGEGNEVLAGEDKPADLPAEGAEAQEEQKPGEEPAPTLQ